MLRATYTRVTCDVFGTSVSHDVASSSQLAAGVSGRPKTDARRSPLIRIARRAAFAAGQGEIALVFRRAWVPCVRAVAAAEARFTAALLTRQTLGAALQSGGESFDFQAWLIAALQQQRLVAVAPL